MSLPESRNTSTACSRWTVFHRGEPEIRQAWILGRAPAVLEDRAPDAASGLRRAATRKQLSQYAGQPADKAADCLDKNPSRLRGDEALAQGSPIATGVIEGACRHLVKDGMDSTGARGGLARGEATLELRSLRVSDDLTAYLTLHSLLPNPSFSATDATGRWLGGKIFGSNWHP